MPAFRGHDPARKFHCDVPGCSASFVKRAHLRRHEMTHTQRRDFVCPSCSRSFSRNDSMARHLRRKHPHLYRSPEAPVSSAAGVERLYSGSASSMASSSASGPANFASTSSYSMLSLRSPFDSTLGNGGSPAQRRSDDQRLLPDPTGRSSAYSDVYGRDTMAHSPKGASSAQWHPDGPSRETEHAFFASAAPTDNGMRSYEGRSAFSIKDDADSTNQMGTSAFFSSTTEPMSRAVTPRRPIDEQTMPMYRSNWMQGSSHDPENGQAPDQLQFPWERHQGQVSYVHSSASGGWAGSEAAASGTTSQPFEHSRRDAGRPSYIEPGFPSTALPSGVPSFAAAPYAADPSLQTDVLQSEFFVGTMQPANTNQGWASLDPCMLTMPASDRVRVESGLEPGQQCPDAAIVATGSGVSPSTTSVTAADTYFSVDLRNLGEQGAPVAPPNAGQVEQIMAELGIDFASSQASTSDASHSFPPPMPPAQPDGSMTSAPLIPSQAAMPASWAAERFGPPTSSFNPHSLSQAQSSQSSVYLPSLTASQSEYLGPNATSHRRPIHRVWSSASMGFDANSQTRAPHATSQGFTGGDFDESFGSRAENVSVKPESQGSAVADSQSNPNFTTPHDLFPSQRAARDEEGERKSARRGDTQHQADSVPEVQYPAAPRSQDVVKETSSVDVDTANDSTSPARGICSKATTSSMGPPRQDRVSFLESEEKAEMEIDEPPLPIDAKQRNSSASASTSAVSGDQLQLVVDRFRVFAQLCQDHMHPSAEMLECLAPLVSKVVHGCAPFYNPKMIGSQKVHSAEEAFALLSLASLHSSDPHLKEEGYRLICFLYGLVMLSYKHTLHLGGKLQSFLNCILLVGMYGVRQPTPDLWHKFEQNRESILLDVLKAETQSQGLDTAMDRIDTGNLEALAEEELFKLWSQWYEHESRKRTLLLCAILDSQSSCFFSPFKMDLSSRPEGPRCQFLFAHVHEPCPDTLFFAWPPKEWARRLAISVSLPSAKGAEIASHDGKLAPIAACLTEHLLRRHVAHQYGHPTHPHFRSSFDFGASKGGPEGFKLPRLDSDKSEASRAASAAPFVEVTEPTGTSARSSRRPSNAEMQETECDAGTTASEARVVSQLYMSALLEAVNGAWMTDSGWYQTPAWGATAMAEQLEIDDKDFDAENASLADLPGWRVGRTLHATQVAHALMNWSEMFSGWKDGCHTNGSVAAAELGLKVTDDAHQLTIRWQAVFLGLCTPLQSICFFLDTSKRSSDLLKDRHRRVSLLLKKWVDSPHCRRALVHAGTILTLLCAARTRCKKARLGPTTSHAVYMALAVVICTNKILRARRQSPRQTNGINEQIGEELVPTKEAWSTLIRSEEKDSKGKATESTQECNGSGQANDDQEWLRVRFWHRKFQFLGLAGIFRGHEEEGSYEVYADWRASVSAGAGVAGPPALRRPPLLRPRWSSFAGQARWPEARRETISGHHPGTADHRRSSHAHILAPQQDTDRDLLRRHLRNSLAGTNNASSETRRWILQGSTYQATFCGFALWSADDSSEMVPRQNRDTTKLLGREQLRELVMWVREDNPAWCFSQEYTSLLLGALQDDSQAEGTGSSSTSYNSQGCTV